MFFGQTNEQLKLLNNTVKTCFTIFRHFIDQRVNQVTKKMIDNENILFTFSLGKRKWKIIWRFESQLRFKKLTFFIINIFDLKFLYTDTFSFISISKYLLLVCSVIFFL